MKAARFEYVRPSDLEQVLMTLAKAEGGAKLLAGGQSLDPMLNLRLARHQRLLCPRKRPSSGHSGSAGSCQQRTSPVRAP
jgi:hypothetical protein